MGPPGASVPHFGSLGGRGSTPGSIRAPVADSRPRSSHARPLARRFSRPRTRRLAHRTKPSSLFRDLTRDTGNSRERITVSMMGSDAPGGARPSRRESRPDADERVGADPSRIARRAASPRARRSRTGPSAESHPPSAHTHLSTGALQANGATSALANLSLRPGGGSGAFATRTLRSPRAPHLPPRDRPRAQRRDTLDAPALRFR